MHLLSGRRERDGPDAIANLHWSLFAELVRFGLGLPSCRCRNWGAAGAVLKKLQVSILWSYLGPFLLMVVVS